MAGRMSLWQKPLSNYTRALFITILLFSVYHFARDILQTFGLDNIFTDILHWPHAWCGQYCDVVTWPLDIAGIGLAAIVLRQNKIGVLGILLLATLPLWLIFTWLP